MENMKPPIRQEMLNKVPEITIYFWIIKILCTTVGETAADFLNTSFNLGLSSTSLVMGVLLVVSLFFQLMSDRYKPSIYWLTVVLISIVGTLITDNLVDNFGATLLSTTCIFGVILAGIFAVWYAVEKTLSIHTIYTMRREVFYWLAILFTFALGTAAGDLTAEVFGLGYSISILLFAAIIAIIYFAYKKLSLHPVFSFWIAYILTRPLGASFGDYLSQPKENGGLALGTTLTSGIFLLAILMTVVYISRTKKDTRNILT
jgi:uncharacterized membrane-anchored protein